MVEFFLLFVRFSVLEKSKEFITFQISNEYIIFPIFSRYIFTPRIFSQLFPSQILYLYYCNIWLYFYIECSVYFVTTESLECSLIIGVASNVRSHDITTIPLWVLAKNIFVINSDIYIDIISFSPLYYKYLIFMTCEATFTFKVLIFFLLWLLLCIC